MGGVGNKQNWVHELRCDKYLFAGSHTKVPMEMEMLQGSYQLVYDLTQYRFFHICLANSMMKVIDTTSLLVPVLPQYDSMHYQHWHTSIVPNFP
jgi:uncharacterized membrane protein YjgN (DUF898 family)